MKITPHPVEFDLLASDLVRHPGLHASNIYNSLFEELEPKRFVKGSKLDPVRMALGTAWEKHFEHLLIKSGAEAHRPDEFRSPEGITYSPDLLLTHKGELCLGELKLTWQSSREAPRKKNDPFPPKFDKYLCQMMLYMHWMDLTLGWLCAYFVNGAYTNFSPELLSWYVEFSRRELVENYDRLMRHAKTTKLIE